MNIEYDKERDVLTIEGMRYSGSLFRAFAEGGLQIGKLFWISSREDGVIQLCVMHEDPDKFHPVPIGAKVIGYTPKGGFIFDKINVQEKEW